MRTKNDILQGSIGERITPEGSDMLIIIEVLVDIRDSLVEIEKRLTEIGGQFEDMGGEARMNMRIAEHNER